MLLVILDAMGTPKAMAAQMTKGGADYLLALIENYPTRHQEVTLWMDTEFDAGRLEVLEVLKTLEKDHNRSGILVMAT